MNEMKSIYNFVSYLSTNIVLIILNVQPSIDCGNVRVRKQKNSREMCYLF